MGEGGRRNSQFGSLCVSCRADRLMRPGHGLGHKPWRPSTPHTFWPGSAFLFLSSRWNSAPSGPSVTGSTGAWRTPESSVEGPSAPKPSGVRRSSKHSMLFSAQAVLSLLKCLLCPQQTPILTSGLNSCRFSPGNMTPGAQCRTQKALNKWQLPSLCPYLRVPRDSCHLFLTTVFATVVCVFLPPRGPWRLGTRL
jgi:hypothetical protein